MKAQGWSDVSGANVAQPWEEVDRHGSGRADDEPRERRLAEAESNRRMFQPEALKGSGLFVRASPYPVGSDDHLLSVTRYVERKALRATLVEHTEQ
jgi:hypothetical protein